MVNSVLTNPLATDGADCTFYINFLPSCLVLHIAQLEPANEKGTNLGYMYIYVRTAVQVCCTFCVGLSHTTSIEVLW